MKDAGERVMSFVHVDSANTEENKEIKHVLSCSDVKLLFPQAVRLQLVWRLFFVSATVTPSGQSQGRQVDGRYWNTCEPRGFIFTLMR